MRGIDKLGRIVIPMELRRKHGIVEGGRVEFIDTEDGITVRAVRLQCRLCGACIPDERELLLCDECIDKTSRYRENQKDNAYLT